MSAKSRVGSLIFIVLLVIILFSMGSWYIKTRNEIISQEEDVALAWAEVENQLKRRSDLIPNFVATVKGYAQHEEEVFTQIADARARLAGAGSVAETSEGYNAMESALSRLLVISENYPELKADRNFIALQDELAGTENRLAVARKRYNDTVGVFNKRIKMFPGSIIAGGMNIDAVEYFEITEEEASTPKVSF